ncbi:MAG: hypothetical protein QXY90_07045 [Candidatus Anstonellales archaeon]
MICPHCRNVFSPKKVLYTWRLKNGVMRRKRVCAKCKKEFFTSEMTSVSNKIVYELYR